MKYFDNYILASMWAGGQAGSVSLLSRNTSTEQLTFWHPRDEHYRRAFFATAEAEMAR